MKKLILLFIVAVFLLSNFISSEPKQKIEPLEINEISTKKDEITYFYFLKNDPVLDAIAYVESGYNTTAYNKKDGGTGLLQITSIMVYDVNRINRLRGIPIYYTLEDRLDPYKSIEMFYTFNDYYNHINPEEIARAWNSGPKWYTKTHKTDRYWGKVQEALEIAP